MRAAQQATTTIPILAVTDDMVGSGLVRSLADPGGNTTGVSILATELDGKRQDILIEAVPGLRHMATLADVNTTTPQKLKSLEDAARAREVELSIHRVAQSEEVVPAIEAARTSDAAALNVLASPLLFTNRRLIIERAAALRPASLGDFCSAANRHPHGTGFLVAVGLGPLTALSYCGFG